MGGPTRASPGPSRLRGLRLLHQRAIVPDDLEREIGFLAGAERLQASPNTLVSLVDRGGPVKVSFFGGLRLGRVRDPELAETLGFVSRRCSTWRRPRCPSCKAVPRRRTTAMLPELIAAGVGLAEALACSACRVRGRVQPAAEPQGAHYFGDGDLPKLPRTLCEALLEPSEASIPRGCRRSSRCPGGSRLEEPGDGRPAADMVDVTLGGARGSSPVRGPGDGLRRGGRRGRGTGPLRRVELPRRARRSAARPVSMRAPGPTGTSCSAWASRRVRHRRVFRAHEQPVGVDETRL